MVYRLRLRRHRVGAPYVAQDHTQVLTLALCWESQHYPLPVAPTPHGHCWPPRQPKRVGACHHCSCIPAMLPWITAQRPCSVRPWRFLCITHHGPQAEGYAPRSYRLHPSDTDCNGSHLLHTSVPQPVSPYDYPAHTLHSSWPAVAQTAGASRS